MDKKVKIAYLNMIGSIFFGMGLIVFIFVGIYGVYYITSNPIDIDFSMDNNTADVIKDAMKINNIKQNQDNCFCKVYEYNTKNKTYDLVD